jgi:hypothetical protein
LVFKNEIVLPNWTKDDVQAVLLFEPLDELCMCNENYLTTVEERILGMCNDCLVSEEYSYYICTHKERAQAVQCLCEQVNRPLTCCSQRLLGNLIYMGGSI